MQVQPVTPKFLKILIVITILWSKILGLLPFTFDVKHTTLIRHRFPLFYPIVFAISLFLSVVYSYGIVMSNTFPAYASNTIRTLMFVMHFLTTLTVVLTYVRHYTKLCDIEDIFNDCVTIWKLMNHLGINGANMTYSSRYCVLIILNFIVCPVLQFACVCVRMAYLDSKSSDHLLLIVIIAVPQAVTSLVPNLFYIITLSVNFVFRMLNNEVRVIMLSFATLEKKTPFRMQQQFCDLSDRLDAIAQTHHAVTQLTQRINTLLDINLVFWIWVKSCVLLLQCFTCYMYFLVWTLWEGSSNPIQVFVTCFASLSLILVELIMLVNMCSTTMKEVIKCIDVNY